MPEITLRHEIDTDEDTFFDKVCFNATFNKQMYEASMKFPAWRELEAKHDDAKLVRKVQVEPQVGDLPGPLKKVLGDRLAYTEEGTFDKKTKRYTFKVTPNTVADKTKVNGELWAEKIGDKKIRRMCRISVEVKVFMIGSMIEDRILNDLKSAYDQSATFTNRYIQEQGL